MEDMDMSVEINSGVTSQIMDLKTPTARMARKEEIKTGFKNVDDYSKYLQDKYSYMNAGSTSMQGVPVNVNVSKAFLQKCKDDPEKAAYLEENLKAIPDCVKSLCSAVSAAPGSPVVTYASYNIDENGNISCTSGSTNDPDGKIARENAKKKAEENRAAKEKVEKKRAEKKAEQERIEKRRVEKAEAKDKTDEFTISAVGTDVKSITSQLINSISSGTTNGTVGFDVKA